MRKLVNFVFFVWISCSLATAAYAFNFGRGKSMTKVNKMNLTCLEIGRTAWVTRDCKSPTSTVYKGVRCYKCANSIECHPPCRGGKRCVNKRCICPPNKNMVDCNGKCIHATSKCIIR